MRGAGRDACGAPGASVPCRARFQQTDPGLMKPCAGQTFGCSVSSRVLSRLRIRFNAFVKEAAKAEHVVEPSDPRAAAPRWREPEEPRVKRRRGDRGRGCCCGGFGCSPHAEARCQLFETVADPTHLSVTLRHVLKRLLACFLVCTDSNIHIAHVGDVFMVTSPATREPEVFLTCLLIYCVIIIIMLLQLRSRN